MHYDIMFKDEPDMLTMPEISRLLRIGKNQAYELVKNGRLAAVKIGHKLIVPKPALIEFCRNENN